MSFGSDGMPTKIITLAATGARAKNRVLDQAGAYATQTTKPVGVSNDSCDAAVNALSTIVEGIAIVEAGDTVTAGSLVEVTGTVGKIKNKSDSGIYTLGIALESGSSGAMIPVLIDRQYFSEMTTLAVAGARAVSRVVSYDGAYTTQTTLPFGVTAEAASGAATIAIQTQGIVTINAGGTVTAGNQVEVVGAAGQIQDKSDSGLYVVGIALESGTSGDDVSVLLTRQLYNQKSSLAVAGARLINRVLSYDGAYNTKAAAPFGVSAEAAAGAATITVITQGIVTINAGGTVTAGNRVEITGVAGQIQDRSCGTGYSIGIALESGTSGDDIQVLLCPQFYPEDTVALTTSGAIAVNRVVTIAGAYAGKTDIPVGVTVDAVAGAGTVNAQTHGIVTVVVEALEAVTAGAFVEATGSDGKVRDREAGAGYVVGIALESGTPGDEVKIVLSRNYYAA